MSPQLELLATNLTVLLGLLLGLWLLSLVRRDASIIDAFWGTGFVTIAWLTWFRTDSVTPRATLLLGLTTLWGVRLSLHLLLRNLSHGEDRRYAAMRAYHGRRFWWLSLGTVFLLQGVILWLVAFPLQIGIDSEEFAGWTLLDAVGLTVWSVGLFFEVVGDWQLTRFRAKRDHADQVLDRSLWRYTRHPNYFGDCCIWWGHYLISASAGSAWTIFSPLLMTVLLLRVSGVSLLERDIAARRPAYRDYIRRTSAFVPWPPHRE